jgi:integrase
VASIGNVVQRRGIFHFRRVVPTDLRIRMGRGELVRSLATGDPRDARMRASQLYLVSERLFMAVRWDPMLTDAQLAGLVQAFFEHILEEENRRRLSGSYLTEEVSNARRGYWAAVAAKSKDSLARNRLEDARWVAEAMIRKQRLPRSSLSEEEIAQVMQAMLRAGIDLAEALKARYDGDFNYEPRDKLLKLKLAEAPQPGGPAATSEAATTVQETVTPGPLMSDAAKLFRERQVATRSWDLQTSAQAGGTYRLFIDVCGDKPIDSYARQDAGRFREQIERLPKDYGRSAASKPLSLMEIIAMHAGVRAAARSPVISQKTVKRHFSALSALWAQAVPKGEAAENIFKGFSFAGGKSAVDQRQMWDRAALAELFGTPVWSGCKSAARRTTPGTLVLRDARFWLPLVGVFSGMREEEICQLQIEDIREEIGIWFMDINSRAPRKLKNSAAVRKVPIHSELVRVGFLAYVDAQRSKGMSRVFPDLKPGGADGRLGHGFAKWFSRYRQEVGIFRPGLDFHSFRHTATTLMHQAGIEHAVLDHVTGHVTPGETSRYTKGSILPQLARAIESIRIDFDFSALYVGTR